MSAAVMTPSAQAAPSENLDHQSMKDHAAEDKITSSSEHKPTPPCLRYQPPFLDRVENIEEYRPGGLHPVHLEQPLDPDERFIPVQKLGDGGFATVWLCRDLKEAKWRAVKVLAAEKSNDDCPEITMLEALRCDDENENPQFAAARKLIALPLEHFWLDGPNGRHLCFVLPLFGAAIDSLSDEASSDSSLLKHICRQMTEAMAYLHSRGICHGDFRPSNILFRLTPEIDDLDYDQMMELYRGAPETEDTWMANGDEPDEHVPQYLVNSRWLPFDCGYMSTDIAVIDFGVAFLTSKDPAPGWTGIPGNYVAPESFLLEENCTSLASDVWALAASICQIRTNGIAPLAGNMPHWIYYELEDMLGPMPMNLRPAWRARGLENYEGDVVTLDGEEDPTMLVSTTLERIAKNKEMRLTILGYEDLICSRLAQAEMNSARTYGNDNVAKVKLSADEIRQLADLLKSVFKWAPEDRPTAAQLLQHEWFKDTAEKESQPEVSAAQDAEDAMDVDEVPLAAEETGKQAVDLDKDQVETEMERQRRMTMSAGGDGKATTIPGTYPLEHDDADIQPRGEVPVRPGMWDAVKHQFAWLKALGVFRGLVCF